MTDPITDTLRDSMRHVVDMAPEAPALPAVPHYSKRTRSGLAVVAGFAVAILTVGVVAFALARPTREVADSTGLTPREIAFAELEAAARAATQCIEDLGAETRPPVYHDDSATFSITMVADGSIRAEAEACIEELFEPTNAEWMAVYGPAHTPRLPDETSTTQPDSQTTNTNSPDLLPFVDSPDLPADTALLSMVSDGVSIDVYDRGGCATIVEHVPGYGYLVDEFCPGSVSPSAFGPRFGTPSCPIVDFGDECEDWLPIFVVGRTVEEAAFVCVSTGRVEVRAGWWLTTADNINEAFPLTTAGVRLDSVTNEFDDRMRERCNATDFAPTEALLEIRPTGVELPVTVELDQGVSGNFTLYSGFEPFIYATDLPIGGPPMLVVVYNGADGRAIGNVSVPEPPQCNEPVFALDLATPSGEWTCDD